MSDRPFLSIEHVVALTWFELRCRETGTDKSEKAVKAVHALLNEDEVADPLGVQMARLLCAFYLESEEYGNVAFRMITLIDRLEWFNSGIDWDSAGVLSEISHPKHAEEQ